MANFRVDSDQIAMAVAGTQASMSRVQGEVAGLLAQLTNLQNSWSGEAATSFHSVVEMWRGTQMQVDQSMANINQALAMAGNSYGTVEQDVRRMFTV